MHFPILGFVTMSPALIGSGLKIYVYMKLPYLGLEETFRQELLDQHGLECVNSKQQFTYDMYPLIYLILAIYYFYDYMSYY